MNLGWRWGWGDWRCGTCGSTTWRCKELMSSCYCESSTQESSNLDNKTTFSAKILFGNQSITLVMNESGNLRGFPQMCIIWFKLHDFVCAGGPTFTCAFLKSQEVKAFMKATSVCDSLTQSRSKRDETNPVTPSVQQPSRPFSTRSSTMTSHDAGGRTTTTVERFQFQFQTWPRLSVFVHQL